MGQRIIHAIEVTDGIALTAAIESPDHPLLGQEVASLAPLSGGPVVLTDNLATVLDGVDVVIDFTEVESTLRHASAIGAKRKSAVIGTTGLSPFQTEQLKEKLTGTQYVFAPNMSIGVNLMFKVVDMVSRVLGDGFDVEVIEAHHRMKKDAPSGTAVRLAEILAEALQRDLTQAGTYGRKGVIGERTLEEIGIHAVRGGDIVGEHTVLFAGPGERFEVTHRAHSRDTFARGAVKAALWVVNQPPGMYAMEDVLGL
jgi:4-hydroxy-tetrahydrodipicolinate reductase